MVAADGQGESRLDEQNVSCDLWKKRTERPNVGGISARSGNGAPARKGVRGQWSNDQRKQQMSIPPLPRPPYPPPHYPPLHTPRFFNQITYEAKVTVPLWAKCLMSALEKGAAQPVGGGGNGGGGEEKHTFSWEQAVPMPSYLIAIAVGDLESREISPRCV